MSNNTINDHRNGTTWWTPFWLDISITSVDLYNGDFLCFTNRGTAANNYDWAWDDSWSILGVGGLPDNATQQQLQFQQIALSFDTARSRQSLDLIDGGCGAIPLNSSYQLLTNTQLALTAFYHPGGVYGSHGQRNSSEWAMPIYLVTVVAVYWSRMTVLWDL